ncbi:response regulator transcription factor [Agromyces ramosus]|uniref:DNA-binding NarL/FixJ family response regulator n=1 Tax=Agromyces ramosus TaxID=33879 RepID=A0ABU0RB27_9MICO|nr:response regulator transcription factor [Agromyces ramosus]MDQ0895278.1 DNA-binding NarL/FixJ family response regulator [Agromyces ramosus]
MASNERPDPGAPYRLAILDDHGLIVDSLARWFADLAPEFDVVLKVTTWMDLIRAPEFPVDLVLMDLQLGDTVSIEARIRACRAAGAKVLVVTALDDDESRERCLAAGASGFIPKTLRADVLVDSARRVARGERLPRHPSRTDAPYGTHGAPSAGSPAADHDASSVHLSGAEERALRYYAQGLSTAEVGRRMEVGYETAKTYLRRVRDKYAKAGRPASRKAELIRRAAEDGYLE